MRNDSQSSDEFKIKNGNLQYNYNDINEEKDESNSILNKT